MPQINLLPWREKLLISRRQELTKKVIYFAIAFILAVIIIVLFFNAKINNQKARNNYLRNEITLTKNQSTNLSIVTNKRKTLIKKINETQALYTDQRYLIKFLNDFVTLVPKEIRIIKLKLSDNDFSIFGESYSYQAITRLFQATHKINYLKSQEIEQITRKKIDGGQIFLFKITAIYKIAPKDVKE